VPSDTGTSEAPFDRSLDLAGGQRLFGKVKHCNDAGLDRSHRQARSRSVRRIASIIRLLDCGDGACGDH
jgi:hypothetical protein